MDMDVHMQIAEQPDNRANNHNSNMTKAEIEHRAVTHIKGKIIHVLSIYPKLMPSMLQVGIGPSISPGLWHPILEALISEGIVDRQEVGNTSPQGRYNKSTVLSLTPFGISLIAKANTNTDAQVSGKASPPNASGGYPTADELVVSREVGSG